jgi:hypothetical protein
MESPKENNMSLLAASGIGAVGSIVGGLISSSAAKRAAQIQQQNATKVAGMATDASKNAQDLAGAATGQAQAGIDQGHTDANNILAANHGDTSALLSGLYDDQKSMLNPYQQAGQQGITSLSSMMAPGGDLTKQFSFDGKDLANEPGYQFQLDQGNKALQSSAAARGALQSGGNMKAMANYNQGLAGTSFGNAYNRALTTFQTNRNNTMQGLNTMIGAGQTANGQAIQAGEFYGGTQSQNNQFYSGQAANNDMNAEQLKAGYGMQGAEYQGNAGLTGAQIAGSALTGGANAQAAGVVGQGNAWNSAIGGVTNAAQYGSLMNMLSPSSGGGSYTPFNPASITPGAAVPAYNPYTSASNPAGVAPQFYGSPQMPSYNTNLPAYTQA